VNTSCGSYDVSLLTCLFLKTSQWQNCLLKSWVKFYLMQPCISPVSIFLRASFCTMKDRPKHIHTSIWVRTQVKRINVQWKEGKCHLVMVLLNV
jgi:hypothetical protein